MEPDPPTRALVPAWYAAQISDPRYVSLDEVLARFPTWLRRLAGRARIVRGLLIFLGARHVSKVALIGKEPGTVTALALESLLRRGPARVVLLEFLPRPVPRAGLKRAIYRVWERSVERPAVRRAMAVGQVLTEAERSEYARRYSLPETRFRHVPWALARHGRPPEETAGRSGVMSSGRADCDWPTLFGAARDANWDLTVVCGRNDLPEVRRLDAGGKAQVLVELSRGEHDSRLREAAVYVICLRDEGPSAGHVRLMAAAGAGTPVIATDARGLQGYAVDGTTAILVPPGDPSALRKAVDDLLAAPERRAGLAEAAFERSRSWTYREYFAAIKRLIEDVPA